MNKQLIFILLCSPGLLAMTKVKLSAPLKLELQDDVVEVPGYVAELSALIQENLSYSVDDTPVSLTQLTKADWELIHEPLALAYMFNRDKTARSHQALLTSLKNLSADELLSCLRTADFLAVQIVFDACLHCAYAGHLNSLSYEQLDELLPDSIEEIIFRQVCAACGPYEAIQVASFNRNMLVPIKSMCVMRNGNIVLAQDNMIIILDREGNLLTCCEGHTGIVLAVCVTTDGAIVSGGQDCTVRVWDMEGNQLAVCEGHESHVLAVCVTKNGKIVSGSADSTVRIWDREGRQLAVCEGHEHNVTAVCITPDDKIVSASFDGTIRIWNMEGNQHTSWHEGADLVKAVCITPEGSIVSGSSLNGAMRIWGTEGNRHACCEGHTSAVGAVCITKNGKIVSGSWDRTVRIWDTEGNQLAVCECKGGHDIVNTCCVARDGKILSGHNDGTVRVWDIALSLTDAQAKKVWIKLQRNPVQEETKLHDWKQIKRLLQENEESQRNKED